MSTPPRRGHRFRCPPESCPTGGQNHLSRRERHGALGRGVLATGHAGPVGQHLRGASAPCPNISIPSTSPTTGDAANGSGDGAPVGSPSCRAPQRRTNPSAATWQLSRSCPSMTTTPTDHSPTAEGRARRRSTSTSRHLTGVDSGRRLSEPACSAAARAGQRPPAALYCSTTACGTRPATGLQRHSPRPIRAAGRCRSHGSASPHWPRRDVHTTRRSNSCVPRRDTARAPCGTQPRSSCSDRSRSWCRRDRTGPSRQRHHRRGRQPASRPLHAPHRLTSKRESSIVGPQPTTARDAAPAAAKAQRPRTHRTHKPMLDITPSFPRVM